jgi:type VI secretion system protein ImpM
MQTPGTAGCFGKVRGNGDFVSRRLPRTFVEPWDAMLQTGMLATRAALGHAWLDAYLDAPLWCFALGGDIVGGSGWAGVLMPSVDLAGRHFPLTIAAPVDPGALPLWLPKAGAWFGRCRELALATLEKGSRLNDLDEGLVALSPVCPTVRAGPGIEVPDDAVARGMSVWWTEGSDSVAPSLRGCSGLPDAARFAGLIDGRIGGCAWHRPLTGRAGI